MVNLSKNGVTKQAPTGFSWTTLFFGFFPALIRGDIKWGLIMIVISMITGGISLLVFPFIYNKFYIKELLKQEYVPSDESSANLLKSMGVYDKDFLDKTVETVSQTAKNISAPKGASVADELKKWQDLFNDGAITLEEYEKKKQELLNK